MEVKQLTNNTQSSEKKLNKPQGFFLCTQVTAAEINFKGELQMPPPPPHTHNAPLEIADMTKRTI